MATVPLDIYPRRGDDYMLRIVMEADGDPIPIQQRIYAARVLRDDDDDLLASFRVGFEDVDDENILTLALSPVDTITLPPAAVWDCREIVGGLAETIFEGRVYPGGEG